MKTKFKLGIFCGLTALLVSVGAQAENTFTFGGDVELDITAKNVDTGAGDVDSVLNGGRIKLDAVGEIKNESYFVKGVAQPLIPFADSGDGIDYDDVYLQIGQSGWDVQLGRFKGFDLVPVGKDTVVENAGDLDVYRADAARGRRADVLHGALHLNASEAAKFELGAMVGKNGDVKFSAVRPAVIYNAGAVEVRAGAEMVNDETGAAKVETKGYGVSAGFNVGGGTLNAGVAQRKQETADVDDPDLISAAVNYTHEPWGVGYIHSQEDSAGDPTLDTLYAAYTVQLFGSKDASMTFAASTSKADNDFSNKVDTTAVRLRFNYAF